MFYEFHCWWRFTDSFVVFPPGLVYSLFILMGVRAGFSMITDGPEIITSYYNSRYRSHDDQLIDSSVGFGLSKPFSLFLYCLFLSPVFQRLSSSHFSSVSLSATLSGMWLAHLLCYSHLRYFCLPDPRPIGCWLCTSSCIYNIDKAFLRCNFFLLINTKILICYF